MEYLFGLGAAKAGTTLLYMLMCNNRQFDIGKEKELHYFDTVENPSKSEYDALFLRGKGVKLDITPAYMFFDGCMKSLTGVVKPGSFKAVVILRDPVERAISHYRMVRRIGYETVPFEDAFKNEKSRMAKDKVGYKRHSYFQRGLYAKQLDEILRCMPREDLRVYVFEDFVKNQQAVVDDIVAWAGLERFDVSPLSANVGLDVKNAHVAKAMRVIYGKLPAPVRGPFKYVTRFVEILNTDKKGKYRSITPQMRRTLVDFYSDDVKRLRDEYGVDVSKWKNFSDLT